MRMPSASAVERALSCGASMVLPRISRTNKYAERGTAVHAYVARALTAGKEIALAETPEEFRDVCESMDIRGLVSLLDGHPKIEAAYAYDVLTDKARLIGYNKGRNYGPRAESEIVGTADFVTEREHELAEADLKTGHYIQDAADSWQLKTLALMSARYHGKDTVHATLVRMREDGSFYYSPTVTWTAFELDEFANELRRLYHRLKSTSERYEKTKQVDVYPGSETCQWCDCAEQCPAFTSAIGALMQGKFSSVEDKGAAWQEAQRAEKILKRAKEALKEFARRQPYKTPTGKYVREVEEPRESIDPTVAYGVIANLCDFDTAHAIVEQSVTKKRLREVLKGRADEILEAIRAQDGVKVETRKVIDEVDAA